MRLVTVITLASLASCTAMLPAPANRLVGEWRYSDGLSSCRYIFRKDGTFRAEVAYGQAAVFGFTGRWRVRGEMLCYENVQDDAGQPPAGTTDPDKLLSVEKDYFVILAPDGRQRRYDRLN